jgi:rhodanese-related sulfurtransferase
MNGRNRIRTIILLVLGLSLAGVAAIGAGELETPTTLTGCKIISVDEAKKLFDEKSATFVDTRNPLNYGKGHVPGANLIEYKGSSENKPEFDGSKDQFDLSKLPDKRASIVFYGHGVTGWKAYKGAVHAIKAGYGNVMWFRGGMEEWEKKGHPKE